MADQTGSSRRRRNLALAVVATAVVSAGVGIVVGRSLQSPADAAAAAKAPEPSRITVPVERRTLVSRLIANGDVQYTEPTPLRLAGAVGASAGSAQVVTKVPALDQALAEGDVVMEVSGRPIFVFQGDLPTYRGLEPGSSGPDVRQLEEALLRLGTFTGTPDDRYDDATESAIDALYDGKGYKSEGPSDDQRARLRTAEKAVADSNKALNSARQELAKGKAGLTGSGLLAAQQQLQGARDAVPAAEAAAVRSNADATAGVVTATALRDGAMKARNAAKALRDAAVVPGAINPDTGFGYTAFEIAQLDDALATKEATLLEADASLRGAIGTRDQTALEGAKNIKSAQDALALQELTYTEQVAPKDTGLLVDAVNTAQQQLDQATADLKTIQVEVGTKIPSGEMIFLPVLPSTLTDVTAEAGKAPTDPFATVSGTDTLIQGRVAAADAGLIEVPSAVDLVLRDANITTTGTITAIDKQSSSDQSQNGGFGGSSSGSDSRLVITVRPDNPEELSNYVGFPVRITITVTSTAGEVLAVPVSAISVGADGESRVEVERKGAGSATSGDATTELVKVTVGLTAEGYAEITALNGAPLAAGDRVVVGTDSGTRKRSSSSSGDSPDATSSGT